MSYTPSHQTHNALFRRPKHAYPDIELPVGDFSNEACRRPLNGASLLASFMVHRAVDAFAPSTRVDELIQQRNLLLDAQCVLPDGSLYKGSLIIGKDQATLQAGPVDHETFMSWERTEGKLRAHSVLNLNPHLFPIGQHEPPLSVNHEAYERPIPHRDFDANPALRAAVNFWRIESDLTRTAGQSGYSDNYQVTAWE